MNGAAASLQFLASCVCGQSIDAVMAQIPDARPRPLGCSRPIGAAAIVRRFKPRRYQCSPDRKASRSRRRKWARDGHMPPELREPYSEGEMAWLRVVAGQVKHHGVCDLPRDKIAALAGISLSTAHNARRKAVERGHISVRVRENKRRKNDTNVICITSAEWLAWIKRGPVPRVTSGPTADRVQNTKISYPTKNIDSDDGDGDSTARATPQAMRLSNEIASIVGLSADRRLWSRYWWDSPTEVQSWLDDGRTPETIRYAVRVAMLTAARKRDGPPVSPAYFRRPIVQAVARHSWLPHAHTLIAEGDMCVARWCGPAAGR